MNIDDSGSSNTKDSSRYYVLSGTIIHESDYKDIKQDVFNYKLKHFKDDYIDAEIHVHELYKSQPPFSSVLLDEKYKQLDDLYELISSLPITIISIAKLIFEILHDKWNIFNTAWSILFQRFDSFLQNTDSSSKGKIRIDRSTKEQHKKITEIIETLQKDLVAAHKINHVICEPFFVNSEVSEAIQISDAVSYCTLKHMTGFEKFEKYWNLIESKHYKHSGQIDSYGLNIFPNARTINNFVK